MIDLTAEVLDAVVGATDVASDLAVRVCSPEFYEQARASHPQASDILLDTVAAVAAFDEDRTFPKVIAALGGPAAAGANLFASGAAAAPLVAAWVNGAQANASLLSEGHRGAGGHPAAHIVPAVVAAAQSTGASGDATLLAITAGYEVAVRVRETVGPMRAGLSPNGNWSSIGAAAGVAHLLADGASPAVRAAINISAALAPAAPMSFAHEGTEGYRHYVALGAQLGLSVGVTAAQGWSAPGGVVEGAYATRSTPSRSTPVERPGRGDRPLAITENYFKRHAVCAHLAAAGDAALELRELGVDPDAVDAVVVRCGVAGTCQLGEPRPANRFAARYSLPVVCATGLVHGAAALTEFPAAMLTDERVARLAAVTTLRHDPELLQRYPHGRPTAVAVRLRDGSQREVLVPVPLGDASNPLPRTAIRAKALDILVRARGRRIAEAILVAAGALADGAPISVLTSAFEGQSR